MQYYLAPSILPADMSRLGDAVEGLVAAGVKWIQVDVMDGRFVDNFTYGPCMVEAVRNRVPDDVLVDAHLMIAEPEFWIDDFCKAGAGLVTAHVEATNHLHGVIQQIKEHGVKAGAALNPATPLVMIEDILPDLDMVLIMSVNPGFGGQKFISSVLPKVTALRKQTDKLGMDIDIQVDGGIKLDNVARVARAGANSFVSGSGVFGDPAAKKGDFGPIVKAFMAEIERGVSG